MPSVFRPIVRSGGALVVNLPFAHVAHSIAVLQRVLERCGLELCYARERRFTTVVVGVHVDAAAVQR